MQNLELDVHISALAAQLQPAPSRDRRRHRRAPVALSGAMLDNKGAEHHFEVIDLSAGGIRVKTAATAPASAKIVLYCQTIGRLVGHVTRSVPGEMAMCMTLSAQKKEKIIETMTWIINKSKLNLQEDRRSDRYNATGETTCELQNGRILQCRVLDISLLGMSLETTDKRPHIGEPVLVGRHKGAVARYTEKGFAVDFANGLKGSDPLD
jgi:hypothetical protein